MKNQNKKEFWMNALRRGIKRSNLGVPARECVCVGNHVWFVGNKKSNLLREQQPCLWAIILCRVSLEKRLLTEGPCNPQPSQAALNSLCEPTKSLVHLRDPICGNEWKNSTFWASENFCNFYIILISRVICHIIKIKSQILYLRNRTKNQRNSSIVHPLVSSLSILKSKGYTMVH